MASHAPRQYHAYDRALPPARQPHWSPCCASSCHGLSWSLFWIASFKLAIQSMEPPATNWRSEKICRSCALFPVAAQFVFIAAKNVASY